jgi:nucleotide-binding universal stress UspA family protein
MYQTILVPLDGSSRAESILPHVRELARRFGSRVVLMRVAVHENMQPVPPMELRATLDAQAEVNMLPERDLLAEARNYLTSKQASLSSYGLNVDIRVQEGPVVQGIIDVAETENADLIAMASHGRTGLQRMFYGSVAAGVLNRIDRPLLIIRSRDHD